MRKGKMKRKDLEDRLVEFAVQIIKLGQTMQKGQLEKHFTLQLIRSSSSSALNYGEMQSAESKNDFIHKGSVILKELRESIINLKIIDKADLAKDKTKLNYLIRENNELISIFYKSLKTAKEKRKRV